MSPASASTARSPSPRHRLAVPHRAPVLDIAANLARRHPELAVCLRDGILSFEYPGPADAAAAPVAATAAAGLPPAVGRNAFLRRAGTRLDGARGSVLMLIDIDRLAQLNAAWGQADGDRIVAAVAQRLGEIGGKQGLLSRIGGGSFALLLPAAAGSADRQVQEILQRCSAPIPLDGGLTSISVSVGVAQMPVDGATPEDLLQHADLALQRAQHEGGGHHAGYDPAHLRQLRRHDELVARLRLAVTRREFVLAYQPIVDVAGTTIGAEALLRWPATDGPMPDTADVIAMLEETGLIQELGGWVLREACRQAAEWRRHHPGFCVHVNLSPLQLRSPTLVAEVLQALQDFALPPSALQVEVTEGVLIGCNDIAVRRLAELAAADVRVWIDDFGTGYSSLSYLRLLPVSGIKIDRNFVAGLTSQGGEALLRALAQIATSLSLDMIAEGVESTGQAAALRRLGIDCQQGYIYGAAAAPKRFRTDFLPPE